MHKYVFADTNLFEQFSPITDIDWLALANCESATLLVSSVTIRELNRHKDGAANGRLKRKAAAVLSGLKRYSEQGAPAKIRAGVELEFQTQEPRIDFAAHQLDEQDGDDRLVATALTFALGKGLTSESVLVATGDFGLQLKLRSQPLVGIIPLPDELRLPDEPDAEERLIRELKEEVRTLRDAVPKLD